MIRSATAQVLNEPGNSLNETVHASARAAQHDMKLRTSERRWCGLQPILEDSGHVRLIGEAAGRGDIFERSGAMREQAARAIDPSINQIDMRRLSERFPEPTREAPYPEPDNASQLFETQGLMQPALDELANATRLRRRQAPALGRRPKTHRCVFAQQMNSQLSTERLDI